MRPQTRTVVNAALTGGAILVLFDGIIQYFETREEGIPFWENYDLERGLINGVKGILIGGSLGFIVYKLQKWEEKDLPFCPDNHLNSVLNDISMDKNPTLLQAGKKIRNELKEFLACTYGNILLKKPVDFGSIPKKTAIGGSSDFDILLPFKKGVGTLEGLYNDVYNSLKNCFFSSDFSIRKQKHSIGLTIDSGVHSIHFDIVPARERNDYQETGDLTILKRNKSPFKSHTHTKTNLEKKKGAVVNQPEVRKIIRLLKKYKNDAGLPINSTAVQNLVKEVFTKQKGYTSSSVYSNLTLSMGYIADQMLNRIKVKDIANGNINLIGNLTSYQRNTIHNQIMSDLERFNKNPQYLKDVFEL